MSPSAAARESSVKAPLHSSSVFKTTSDNFHFTKDKLISKPKVEGTSKLIKWISEITTKRRQFRRKTHCSNLFVEALLSNTLRNAQTDLALKQEERRRRLQTFFSTTSQCENIDWERENSIGEKGTSTRTTRSELDEEVQSCLASLDSFFNELDSYKG